MTTFVGIRYIPDGTMLEGVYFTNAQAARDYAFDNGHNTVSGNATLEPLPVAAFDTYREYEAIRPY